MMNISIVIYVQIINYLLLRELYRQGIDYTNLILLYVINDLRFVGIVHKVFSCQNLKKVLVVE